ncbi:ATP-binding cassette domain-containing protein [Bacillus licheniformis]
MQRNGIGSYRFHDAYFGMISSPGFRERFFVVSQNKNRGERYDDFNENKRLAKSFGEQTILKNIDFDISNQERIGLVGYNGAGKTTLANILSGHIEADKGTVQTDRTLKIGYLLQSIEYSVHDFNSILTGDEGGKLYQLTSRLGLSKVQSWNSERLSHLSGEKN